MIALTDPTDVRTITQPCVVSFEETVGVITRPALLRSSVLSTVRLLNTATAPEAKNGVSSKLSENRPRRALFYGKSIGVYVNELPILGYAVARRHAST